MSDAPRPPVAAALARFAVEAQTPPASARAIARLSAFDMLTVGLAGVEEPVARAARAMTEAEPGQATILGADAGRTPRAAALVNGATGHALDYDDTHFDNVGHPSVAVFPAALAAAEETGAEGRDLLDAFLIGAEAAVRLGTWLGAAHYNLGFHQTATSGAFGATLAAARIYGLDAETTAHALGLAATMASGLKSQFGTMGKPLNAGLAAANGIQAAQAARAGLRSRTDGIECAQGFAETHGAEARDWAAAADGMGALWRFETVSYKRHACCHGLHAMLEALGRLRATLGPDVADRVEAVEIRTAPRWMKVCAIESPETGLQAKFSYRLTAAMALAGRDTAALDSYTAELCRDPDLLRLRDRVTVTPVATLGDMQAEVDLRLAGGETVTESHDLSAPIPIETLTAQLQEKSAALLGAARSETLWRAVVALDEGPAKALAAATRA